jgi:hypothetical protein
MKSPSIIKRVFLVHAEDLKKKGYAEVLLESEEPAGSFEERLRTEYDKAVEETKWSDLPDWRFVNHISGKVQVGEEKEGEAKEMKSVTFVFIYRYDPNIKLQISHLQMEVNGVVRTFPLGSQTPLLSPDKMYEKFRYALANPLVHRMQAVNQKIPVKAQLKVSKR